MKAVSSGLQSEQASATSISMMAGGGLLRPLTNGEWMVDEVVGIDEGQEQLYFTGNREAPTERQLYSVSLSNGEDAPHKRRARHAFSCDRPRLESAIIDTHESLDRPPAVTLLLPPQRRAVETRSTRSADSRADSRIERLGLEPPEIVSLQNRDGVTLYGAVYRPASSFGPGPLSGRRQCLRRTARAICDQ